MAGPTRSREELVEALRRQKKALEASSKNFDGGEEWEAERLATTVFNLVFDSKEIISLLARLEVKDSLRFVSSGRMVVIPGLPPPTVAMPSLLIARTDHQGSRFVPKLGGGPPLYRKVAYEDWWKNELIYQEKASGKLNRMRLIFAEVTETLKQLTGDLQ